jgi:hypothetical protein
MKKKEMIAELKFQRKVKVHWPSKYSYGPSPRYKYWGISLEIPQA